MRGRSHDRRKGRNPLHLVSAWAARQRIVLGQQATEKKSNEITAIPLPRHVWVMWQNMRCSILFHFDVPGG